MNTITNFAAGLKKKLHAIKPDDLAREEGGGMGSTQTGWMEGDMTIDWELLDGEIDAFCAEFKAKHEAKA